AALAPASRPARRAPQRRWVPALTPAPFAWAARRKQENHKLQRPAAQRPGERRASFSPPPLRRPWEAQPPLRDAAAHSPQNNISAENCFFRFVALRARREVTMKLIIAGSRTFADYQLLCQTLAPERPRITQVLTGDARGAEQLGYRWAWKHQVKHQLFRAAWERFGKSAGVRRNYQMAQAGDMLLAFWDGQSPGTAHMVQFMRQLGKPVVVIRVEATA